MFSLLGANGAGKTTLFRALTGILVGRSGEIVFRGTNITALRSHEIVRLGIAHIAEGKHLFGPLSVAKNLELGALAVHAGREDEVARARALVYQLFPRLRDRQHQPARTLSGGKQQMLAIAPRDDGPAQAATAGRAVLRACPDRHRAPVRGAGHIQETGPDNHSGRAERRAGIDARRSRSGAASGAFGDDSTEGGTATQPRGCATLPRRGLVTLDGRFQNWADTGARPAMALSHEGRQGGGGCTARTDILGDVLRPHWSRA